MACTKWLDGIFTLNETNVKILWQFHFKVRATFVMHLWPLRLNEYVCTYVLFTPRSCRFPNLNDYGSSRCNLIEFEAIPNTSVFISCLQYMHPCSEICEIFGDSVGPLGIIMDGNDTQSNVSNVYRPRTIRTILEGKATCLTNRMTPKTGSGESLSNGQNQPVGTPTI